MFGFSKSSREMHKKVEEGEIDALLSRGVENIFPNPAFLKAKLLKGERISLYLGIDPTGPTLHLGHAIILKKMAEFQKLGHKIILLIGDFTAMIGDPTDKTALRKTLSREEVLLNLKEYKNQASRFISFKGVNPAEIKFNSEWLSKMNFADVLHLASHMTVQQMLERDMFQKRMEEGRPIYIHEFMYPLMQGYDSVAMNVDGEIGGNDQTFNMLAGRDLLKTLKNKEKFVIAQKLLVDSTGKKMGKSENNMVALNQTPEDMFGKVMSWSDGLILPGFELVTGVSLSEIEEMKSKLEGGANPRDFKLKLASEVVKLCVGEKEAQNALRSFEKTFAQGGIPDDVSKIKVEAGTSLMQFLVSNNIVSSNTDFRRLIEEGAITHMDTEEKITETNALVTSGVYRVGKRRFVQCEVI